MKKLTLLSAIFTMAIFGGASAANITLYYSPTCPHCHHAREFINTTLVYEYPSLKVEAVNVMEQENQSAFQAMLQKCKLESGGVPVLTIGDECVQGYAPVLNDDIRKHIEADMAEKDKNAAVQIRKDMEADAQKVRDAHPERADVITERSVNAEKKSEGGSPVYFYIILAALVLGLGYVLIRKDTKKKKK